jgi:hypothetical protein
MRPPPPKCAPLSGSLATSSQRDALTAGHSKLLLSSEAATEERDEYLMRLLRKGAPPAGAQPAPPAQAPQGAPPSALHQQATQAQPAQAAEALRFRAPAPVSRSVPPSVPAPGSATPPAPSPSRLLPRATSTTLASPSSTAGAGTGGTGGATVPSLPLSAPSATATTTDQAVPTSGGAAPAPTPSAPPPRATPPLPPRTTAAGAAAAAAALPVPTPQLVAVPPELAATFDQTRRMLGDEIALSVRDTMIRQQVMFLEQLYDLHRAIAIQKLLMQNCPEVQQVMGEAMRLMSSVGSQHGSGSGRGSKRQRTTPNGGATVPGSGSGDPSSFRPDSQFAAVPQLPGEAQTRDDEDDDGGSGDANGSGSAGANGSGGGSTSPQQLVPGLPPPPPLPYMYLAHTAVATPSGASAAPVGWQWGMAPLQGQVQQLQQAAGLPPVPRGPPQMAPWVGQDAGLAAVGINTHPPQHLKPATGAPGGKPSKAATAATAPPAPRATAPRPAPVQPLAPARASAPARQPKQPQPAAQPQQPQQASPALAQAPPAPSMAPTAPASLAMLPPGMPPPMPFGPPPPHMMMGPHGPPGLPCPPPGAADPMAWWYNTYYGSQQQQQMGGMSLATAQAAAAAAAAFMQQAQVQPGGTGCTTAAPLGTTGATGTAAGTVTKWWHDPQLTFGPPVDTEMLARRPAGGPAALAREGPEVQSAPAGQIKGPADSRRRSAMPYSDGPRMRLKRKATADADEASSGTTGHTHDPDGGAGTTAGGPFKKHESLRARSARTSPQGPAPAAAADDPMGGGGQDENAAQLLLAIGKQ